MDVQSQPFATRRLAEAALKFTGGPSKPLIEPLQPVFALCYVPRDHHVLDTLIFPLAYISELLLNFYSQVSSLEHVSA
jgi:hypothetical protein